MFFYLLTQGSKRLTVQMNLITIPTYDRDWVR